jgi:hypothetical protein
MQDIHAINVTGRKHFDTEQLRRIPVTVSDAAQTYINGTTQQGRLFPLALSEMFGSHDSIVSVEVDILKKSELFSLAYNEDDTSQLLRITVKHADESMEDGVKIINADDLNVTHPSGLWGFNAAQTAHELLRLHKMERGI